MPIPHFSNPGLSGLDELTSEEEAIVADIASLGTAGQVLATNATTDGVEWVTVAGGGTPVTTKGDLYGYSTTDARIPVGTNGQVLVADSTEALGVKWAAAGAGDMVAATYDPATIAEQLVGLTAAQTLTTKSIDADNNTLTNIGLAEFETNVQDSWGILHGMVLDTPSVTVTSNGTVITLSAEKSGTGDIRCIFSTGFYTWDCTPADTVTLSAGSDASPQINYVYFLESTKTLTASTTGWPATEYVPVATVLCQTAASLQTDGAYKVHAWTDHTNGGSDNMGHFTHLNAWIRNQPATWLSGTALTPTVGLNTFDIAISAGEVLQLHDHTYPAIDTSTGSDVYVVNDPDAAYTKVGDLTIAGGVDKDINGTTLGAAGTDYYNLVIWGVVNEATGDCKLMCNVPDGAYSSNAGSQATLDTNKTAVYSIPSDFTGVGFLIARLTVSVTGTTYTIEQNEDLRGQFPSQVAGGGAVGGNEFADNVFRIQDDGDVTKEIAFQASGITTGTTRTITMPDADVNLGNLVVGPASATDNALVRFDSTTGKLVQNSVGILTDAGVLSVGSFVGLDADFPIKDSSSNSILYLIGGVASAVNYGTIKHSATGNAVEFGALGTDTNIDMLLVPKGSGEVKIGANAVIDAGDTASTTASGIVELATAAEVDTGTDATRAITPDGLAGSNTGKRVLVLQHTESDTAVATGNGTIGIPITAELNGFNIVNVQANVYTKGVTGTTDVQIRRQRGASDVDVLSTKITLGDEYYASDEVINTSNDDLATGDMLFVDVDAVHSGTAPNGLSVAIIAQLP